MLLPISVIGEIKTIGIKTITLGILTSDIKTQKKGETRKE